MLGTRHALAALVIAAPALAQKPAAPAPDLRSFDAYVAKAMKEWEVPGAAIAIVRNDSVVFAKGFGVRKLGESTPVDARTLFAIGSASKAFTVAAIGTLVDEGKMRWDDPITRYLPGFQMYDPYVSRELTVRDVLSHRSGLSRGDRSWYGTEYDRDEILRRVRYLKPTWSFRSEFGYQNLMYLAGGQAAAKVAGRSWDDLVQERIFAPLGMTSSSTSVRALQGKDDVAQPHSKLDGVVQPVPYRNIDNIAPAGSINSNVLDMAQWVRLQLGQGTYAGKQIIAPATVKQMHTPHTVIRLEPMSWGLTWPEAHLMSYGMGWFMNDYKGRLVVHHGGNIDGMSALVAMIPEEKAGAVILTNMNGSPLPTILLHRIMDDLLKLQPTDFSAQMKKAYEPLERRGREAIAKLEASRVPNTKPSLPLEKYAGTYVDSLYGDVVIAHDNGKLTIVRGPNFRGTLEHWHYDTFRAVWDNPALGKPMLSFTIDPSANVSDVRLDFEGPVTFRRAPARTGAAAASGQGSR